MVTLMAECLTVTEITVTHIMVILIPTTVMVKMQNLTPQLRKSQVESILQK